ncbi:MAG: hypothetical protein A2W19_02970 [Spirochaetes bacterium RBG_16_49_21]|nr:MAG: hypothetical protein A2W19_02970 [Spirochaetes bacterium RBG_16_49_21]
MRKAVCLIAVLTIGFCSSRCIGLIVGGVKAAKQKARYDSMMSKNSEARGHFDAGLKYQKEKNHNEALAEFKKAVAVDQKFTMAYYNMGVNCLILKSYDVAVQYLREAVGQEKDFSEAQMLIGHCYYQKKQYNKAIEELTKAIDIDGNEGSQYLARAMSCMFTGDWDKVKKDLYNANSISRIPHFCSGGPRGTVPEWWLGLGLYSWGKDKDKKEALKCFDYAFSKGYRDFDKLYDEKEYGRLLIGLNDTPEFNELVQRYRTGK